MFRQKEIEELDDFFKNLKDRKETCVYFYRINGYNQQISEFIQKYYETARRTGVVIEGKIPNPDKQNLSYYEEIMGMDFCLSMDFISLSLKKWLPRMNDKQRTYVADSLYNSLKSLYNSGKTEAMIENAYIKFMCWLYYKFERIVNQLGNDVIPKILYEGSIHSYELMLISILSNAGCDVILLQYEGDNDYLKLDKDSKLSFKLSMPSMGKFPTDFNLQWLRTQIKNKMDLERLYGKRSKIQSSTNTWISYQCFEDIEKEEKSRGSQSNLFYNCLYRINGVEDKLTYPNELYRFLQAMKNRNRRVVILEEEIPIPTVNEISSIQRKQYNSLHIMLQDLAGNITYPANIDLQLMIRTAFLDVFFEESKQGNKSLNKLVNYAVYLLCWLKRYMAGLFSGWKFPEISCFIYLGSLRKEEEALWIRFLAKLPVDVLLLNPKKDKNLPLSDSIYEIDYEDTLDIKKYPRESELQMGTAAYHAERELDTIMYQDSGMYRQQQFEKAVSITLKTMYEEIELLWDQELKYRPGFTTENQLVNMPVIFAKVSGVKDGQVQAYWNNIRKLLTEDLLLITKTPYISHENENPMKRFAVEFFKNGKLQRTKIKNHKNYPYQVLRQEMQDYILDKLELLIQKKSIRGTFENGTEYTIISVILNLPKEVVRLLQKFDFTRKNPKMIYINTGETAISLEDTILTAFLNLAGFDILFFIPTGYQTIEQFFNKKFMEEHQIGNYMYDLQIPNFHSNSPNHVFQTWRDKIFKRGR